MAQDEKNRFAALIEPQLDTLYRAAYRLYRNRADAEDLVQDVCLKAFDRLEQLESVKSKRAWLLRIEYNVFIDQSRRQSRAPLESLDEDSLATGPSWSPESMIEGEQLIIRLADAWPQLMSEQQALLALHSEGYKLAELTEITGLPLGALKARLHRARVRLGKLVHDIEQRQRFAAVSGESK